MAFISFTKTILSNLFSKPATILYPAVPIKYKTRTRGHISIDIGECIFCGICSKRCPTSAIQVIREEKTWSIEPFSCIQCNSCVELCPKKCLTMENGYTVPGAIKTKEVFKNA